MAQEAFEEIVETFEFLEDWEDRYRHVIDLGKTLRPLAEGLKGPETKVEGCASQVWLVPRLEQGRFYFDGESDAMIVAGLIAILQALYNGVEISALGQVDAQAELARIGLQEHLSAQRSNGLKAMIARIEGIGAAAR
jgi:cysteine desulfuration protein SufE